MEKANKDNPVVKALLCCTSYLISCLDRFVKFISKTDRETKNLDF